IRADLLQRVLPLGRLGAPSVKTLVLLALVGLGAQLVDGSLGMAYGVTSTTLLLAIGTNPAAAPPRNRPPGLVPTPAAPRPLLFPAFPFRGPNPPQPGQADAHPLPRPPR